MGSVCASGETTQTEVAQEPAPASQPVATYGEFTVSLKKEGDAKLGLDISHYNDKTGLKVKGVKDGLVKDWNDANPDSAIEKDDLIIAINGARENSEKMLKEVRNTDLNIVVKKGGAK